MAFKHIGLLDLFEYILAWYYLINHYESNRTLFYLWLTISLSLCKDININKITIVLRPEEDRLYDKCKHVTRTLYNGVDVIRSICVFPFSYNAYCKDLASGRLSDDQLMKYEWHRYLSFKTFPTGSVMTPMRLAQAGFYYLGQREEVRCFCCRVTHSNWSESETAHEAHRRLSPSCPFIHRRREHENIPISAPDPNEVRHEPRVSSPDQSQSTASHCTTIVSILNILNNSNSVPNSDQHILMNEECCRLVTYQQFPHRSDASSIRLSQAGFYYTGEGDTVRCFCCGVTHSDWSTSEIAMDVHRRISPNCRLVRGVESNNVPMHTQTRESQVSTTGHIIEGSGTNNVRYPAYTTYDQRRVTFASWHFPERSDGMAQAGLFYVGGRDLVRCFHCGIGLKDWERDDDPLLEHARHSPECPYLQQNRKLIQYSLDSQANNKRLSTQNEELTTCNKRLKTHNEQLKAENGQLTIQNGQLTIQNGRLTTALNERQVNSQERIRCKICLEMDADIVFLPCNHLLSCHRCAQQLSRCAVCRSIIRDTVRVYAS